MAAPEPDDLAFMVSPFELDPGTDLETTLYYTMGDGDLF